MFIFKPGDKVRHTKSKSHHGDENHMNAVVVSTRLDIDGKPKIKVKYDRNGREGEWLQEYTEFRDCKSAIVERFNRLYSNNVDKVIHDDIADALSYVYIDPTISNQYQYDTATADLLRNGNIKEEIMKAKITEVYENGVLIQTLINDRDINDISSGDLLGYIGNANTTIEKLTKHDGSKCKFISQELKRLHQFIDSVYLILDEKFYKKVEIPEVR